MYRPNRKQGRGGDGCSHKCCIFLVSLNDWSSYGNEECNNWMLDIDMFYTHVWLYHMVECFLIYVVWVHSELIQHLGSGLGNPFSWNSSWKKINWVSKKKDSNLEFFIHIFSLGMTWSSASIRRMAQNIVKHMHL